MVNFKRTQKCFLLHRHFSKQNQTTKYYLSEGKMHLSVASKRCLIMLTIFKKSIKMFSRNPREGSR